MDTTNQLKASLEYEEMLRQQNLLDEYQRLGARHLQVIDIVQIGLPLLVYALCHYFLSLDTSTLFMLQWGCIAYMLVYAIVLAERKRTNRRIDLLFRLMQLDRASRHR